MTVSSTARPAQRRGWVLRGGIFSFLLLLCECSLNGPHADRVSQGFALVWLDMLDKVSANWQSHPRTPLISTTFVVAQRCPHGTRSTRRTP